LDEVVRGLTASGASGARPAQGGNESRRSRDVADSFDAGQLMGDAGEGLIDADTRLQERMDELEEERKAARSKRPQEDPEKVRQRESLKLARTELEQQLLRTEHPARKAQIGQALAEIDKRLADFSTTRAADKKTKK
jgi:hypothetical protein